MDEMSRPCHPCVCCSGITRAWKMELHEEGPRAEMGGPHPFSSSPLSFSAMHHAHYFQGNSVLSWDFKADMKISVPWYLGLAFRTRQMDGVLLQAHAGQYTTLLCQVGPRRGLGFPPCARGTQGGSVGGSQSGSGPCSLLPLLSPLCSCLEACSPSW